MFCNLEILDFEMNVMTSSLEKDKMECSCGHLGDCDPKYMDDLVGKDFYLDRPHWPHIGTSVKKSLLETVEVTQF